MGEEEAARLAARAGAKGRRGRRARERLHEAALAGDLAASRALVGHDGGRVLRTVWRELCGAPVDEARLDAVTSLLRRPDPGLLTKEMRDGVVVAVRLAHPVADIARAKVLAAAHDRVVVDELCSLALRDRAFGAFCVENGLAPSDPARRAVYLTVLGRRGEYRALDPDGTLLQRAYAYATDDDRALIRQAVVAAGDTDLVRQLVAGNRAEFTRLSGPELSAVASPFVDRGDWPALWSLLSDASVLDAATLSRWSAPDWRPESELDKRLLAALRSTDPTQLAKWRDRPTLMGAIRVDGNPNAIAVAPDGGRLAVAWWTQRPEPTGMHLGVFELPGGSLLAHHALGRDVAHVSLAYCRESLLCGTRLRGLVRYTDAGEETVTDRPVVAVAAAGGVFAAVTTEGVLLGSADRTDLYRVPAEAITVTGLPRWWRVSVSPDGRRVAVAASDRFAVIELSDRTVTWVSPGDVINDVTFLGPDEIVTAHAGAGQLRRWRAGTGALIARGATHVPRLTGLVVLPDLSALALRSGSTPSATLDFADLDAVYRSSERPWPGYLHRREVGGLMSGNGHTIAVTPRREDVIEVHDLSLGPPMSLLTTPASDLRPDDLRVVVSGNQRDPRIRLLRLALERRFGAELALGSSAAAARRPDDIALAEDA